jgi:CDP-6-deoxy-D-xylo-4-hexulose-3-dehydrase
MLRVHPEAKFTASELASHLDENKIGNRMLFGGNLLRQPVFVQLRKERRQSFRVVGQSSSQPLDDKSLKILLAGADEIMKQALFLGVYPGLSKAQIKQAIEQIKAFVAAKS